MLPGRRQYRRWSLSAKWSFWASVVGIPASILSFVLAFGSTVDSGGLKRAETNHLMFRVAQELRYNTEWLREMASAYRDGTPLPIGSLETSAIIRLMEAQYELVTKHSYGEEKYIYQEALRLKKLGEALSVAHTLYDIKKFERRSAHTLHDVIFLNDFLRWYLAPHMQEVLSDQQVYALGCSPFPGPKLRTEAVEPVRMKYFVHDGESIQEFSLYLGLID